jgi:hypothetical protein
MPLSSFAPYSGATFPRTGGAADPIADSGGDLNKHRLIFTTEDFVLQRKVDVSVSVPKPLASAPNGYTQGRREIFIRFPMLLDNGNYTTNTAQILLSADVENTDAEIRAMRDVMVQAIDDSSFDGVFNDLSVA